MKVCEQCGLEYQPITGVEHNGIHVSRENPYPVGSLNYFRWVFFVQRQRNTPQDQKGLLT